MSGLHIPAQKRLRGGDSTHAATRKVVVPLQVAAAINLAVEPQGEKTKEWLVRSQKTRLSCGPRSSFVRPSSAVVALSVIHSLVVFREESRGERQGKAMKTYVTALPSL
jgi:hypothetical protein